MADNQNALRIFLCYAREDVFIVRSLYKRLTADGFEVWFDEKKLIAGQDYDIEIDKATRNADVIVICLSKKSIVKEGYLQKEIKRALSIAEEKAENTIYIIPLRLEECEVPVIRMQKLQWVNYFERDGYKKLIQALLIRKEQIAQNSAENLKAANEMRDREKRTSLVRKYALFSLLIIIAVFLPFLPSYIEPLDGVNTTYGVIPTLLIRDTPSFYVLKTETSTMKKGITFTPTKTIITPTESLIVASTPSVSVAAIGYINGYRVNCRIQPNIESPSFTQLDFAEIALFGRLPDSSWYLIKAPGDNSVYCWVNSKYITTDISAINLVANLPVLTPEITPTPTQLLAFLTPNSTALKVVIVSAKSNGLNCREGPGLNYPVIVLLQEGQVVKAIAKNLDSSWAYVQTSSLKYCWLYILNTAVEPAGDISVLPSVP